MIILSKHFTLKLFKMKNLFTLVLFALISACTSTKYNFEPIAANHAPIFTDGASTLQQSVGNLYFDMDLTKGYKDDLKLRLFISNNSDSTITFDPKNLQLFGLNKNGEGRRFKTYTAEEYLDNLKDRDLNRYAILVALQAATAILTKTDPYYDTFIINTDTPYRNNNGVLGSEVNLFRPKDGLIRKHTLAPGEALEGDIIYRLKSYYTDKIILKYPVQDSVARFYFEKKI
jgi:hypothetical protein